MNNIAGIFLILIKMKISQYEYSSLSGYAAASGEELRVRVPGNSVRNWFKAVSACFADVDARVLVPAFRLCPRDVQKANLY